MNESHDSENFNFWPVYSDLAIVMILVLALLAMGLMVLVTHLYALVPTSVLDAQSEVRAAVRKLEGSGVRVCEERGSNQEIVLSSDVVWEPQESSIDDMKSKGRDVVYQLGSILATKQDKYQRIQIEGHASYENPALRHLIGLNPEAKARIEREYGMKNWRLSADRAGAVMQAFMIHGVPAYKISAAARGHYHPVIDKDECTLSTENQDYSKFNLTKDQRERNRRINILIMYGAEEH